MLDWCRNAQLLSQPTSTQTLGWWSLPVFLLGFPLWLLTAGCSSFLPVLVTTRKDVWFVTLNWRWKVSEWSLVRRMSGISEIRNITLRSTEYNEDYKRNIFFFSKSKTSAFYFLRGKIAGATELWHVWWILFLPLFVFLSIQKKKNRVWYVLSLVCFLSFLHSAAAAIFKSPTVGRW